MKKFLSAIFAIMITAGALAADASGGDDKPTPVQRVSIFSTSTDWEGVTGLQLSEYRGKFVSDSRLVGSKGLVLYYLDGFPCYGLGEGVRIWIDPRGRADNDLRIVCLRPPKEIKFAWRNMTRDGVQKATTGLLTCPVSDSGRDLTIELSKCQKGPDWPDYE